jgi:ABC-type glycerol-3-phosphate transport system permease component
MGLSVLSMKRTKFQKVVLSIFSVLFFIYALSLIFPFLWTLYNSLKDNREFFAQGGVWSLPKKLMFTNYLNVWKEYNLVTYFINSIKITVIGATLSILSSSMSAYIVAKYNFKFRRTIYVTAVSVMLIPGIGSLAALYKFMNQTGLYNTHIGIELLYAGGLGISFLIMYGFFQSISWSYAEAAFVDGATDWQVFYYIMLPQAKPALGAVAIIQGISIWNDYFTPFMFLADKNKFTLAVGLRQIVLEQSYSADWTKMFAAMIIATIPILIVYVIFQNTLIENTVAGGLKG